MSWPAWLSECRAAHKSKLNAFLSGSSSTSSKRNLQHVVTRETERERKGTRRVATVQININHCVIIFCCQLNLSKVFIIHKCKTTFDKSFRPRSAPDKVRDRERKRRAAYLSCVCLRQLLLGPNSNTLPPPHPSALLSNLATLFDFLFRFLFYLHLAYSVLFAFVALFEIFLKISF